MSSTPISAPRPIVLTGIMGAGKSCIGRRLAERLDLPFIDADAEITKAAGCSIPEIFERHGEGEFRNGERRVIARLLKGPVHVLSTGGGAFMDPRTRELILEKSISLWLRADLEVLLNRVKRRSTRPLLLTGDPREILKKLMAERYPVYAQADIIVDSLDVPPEVTVGNTLAALMEFLNTRETPRAASPADAAGRESQDPDCQEPAP